MKCSNCGSELADGAKFCGECGTKVVPQNTCPECGAICPAGAKFCVECGHKFGTEDKLMKTTEKSSAGSGSLIEDVVKEVTEESIEPSIDWDSVMEVSDANIPLTSDQVDGVRLELQSLRFKAKEGRVLLADEALFAKKFAAFKKRFGERVGLDLDEIPLFEQNSPIGMIVNGEKGTGERATLFTKGGIFFIDKDFPWNDGKGEPIGGIVPWKIFYIFGERINNELGKTCYRLAKPCIVLKSDRVSDEVKQRYRDDLDREHGDKGLLFRFGDTGLDADDVEEFMDALKVSLVGDDECDEMLDEEEEE